MPEKLKNIFFTKVFVENLAKAIKKEQGSFDKNKFMRLVFDQEWKKLELKAKMRHITGCLYETLPDDYVEAVKILKKVAPHFSGFDAMVFPDYVECYGLNHEKISLDALKLFTKCCSSEFGIRPFLLKNPIQVMSYMEKWAKDQDPHVRRLASEGCRPRLPWARALPYFKKDPRLILSILDILKGDPSEYVRRSVANNLNDISKDHQDLVLDICENWYGESKEINWLVKHACRDMLKAAIRELCFCLGLLLPRISLSKN